MDVSKLIYFYTAAEYEHITRASEKLLIAQPALTKSIKILEDELGVPLFYKQGRNIKLTEYGKFLKEKLDIIIPNINSIPSEINKLKTQVDNTVKLNVLAASTAVTDAIISYKKKNQEVIFELTQNAESEFDIMMTTDTIKISTEKMFDRQCVMEEKIYLAVPMTSKYALKSSINLEDVKDEGFVQLAGSRFFRVICDSFCRQAGFTAKTAFESDSPAVVHNIIAAGVGIGFWPEYSWEKKLSSDVVLVPIEKPECKRELIVYLNKRKTSSHHAEEFYNHLIEHLKKRKSKMSGLIINY